MRIFKEEKRLELWLLKESNFQHFKDYDICSCGDRGLGPKTRCGDGYAPEGFYYVTPNQMNPYSKFHLSFNLGYPNRYDRLHGRTGSALMVHGFCCSIGCYAMTNKNIEEIYTLAEASLVSGQTFFRVHVFPFHMDAKKLKEHTISPLNKENQEWCDFWTNLKEGYDYFSEHGNNPPNVEVKNARYVFE